MKRTGFGSWPRSGGRGARGRQSRRALGISLNLSTNAVGLLSEVGGGVVKASTRSGPSSGARSGEMEGGALGPGRPSRAPCASAAAGRARPRPRPVPPSSSRSTWSLWGGRVLGFLPGALVVLLSALLLAGLALPGAAAQAARGRAKQLPQCATVTETGSCRVRPGRTTIGPRPFRFPGPRPHSQATALDGIPSSTGTRLSCSS